MEFFLVLAGGLVSVVATGVTTWLNARLAEKRQIALEDRAARSKRSAIARATVTEMLTLGEAARLGASKPALSEFAELFVRLSAVIAQMNDEALVAKLDQFYGLLQENESATPARRAELYQQIPFVRNEINEHMTALGWDFV